MWNRIAIWWWRKHNACVFCKNEAHLYYMGVPICEFCLNILGEVATDETAKEVLRDERVSRASG